LHHALRTVDWGSQFQKSIQTIDKQITLVNDYRTKTLVPSIDKVYALRLKQLSLGKNENTIVLVNNIQNEIDALDNNADSKAEEVFQAINNIEKATSEISNVADNEQLSFSRSSKIQNFVMMAVGFALALAIALLLSNYLVKNVNSLKEMIESLRKGILPQKAEIKTTDEIAEITDSLNHLTEGLQSTSSFAQEIGKGNFELEFEPLSNEDVLGNSLINMRSNLIKVAEDEKKRNWATEGLAKFGDILRGNSQSLDELADDIISNLVRYLEGNQGGLFILNDANINDKYLELIACYAWNKKKFIHMRIEEGEGLVGQCWQENDTLYITDVPSDYVKITSGLGDANPSSFLIVPLTVNDQTFGVVEIASFHLFEKYQIEFVEKLAESIASTLSTAKTNERTKVLLEQSQQQTEEMRAQEEEMRQNMEEMQATQEEMERKEAEMSRMVEQMQQQEEEMRQNMEEMVATQEEMEKQNAIIAEAAANTKGILDGVNATMATIEFTPDGFVITANENFNTAMKTSLEEIQGKHHSGFVPIEIKDSSDYQTFWTDLSNGKEKKGVFKRKNANGEIVWLNAIYNPVKNANGEVIKVVKLATDITEQKELEAQSKAQTDIINDIAIVSKTDLQGNITYVNDEFLKWSKYSREEVMGKNHRILKSGDQDDQIFVDMWKTISSGKIFRGEIKNKAKDGSFYWVDAIVAPVLDDLGKPKEYIAQRFVINEQKAKE
jgi:methyl-accepting chemotaxis protein